MRTIYIASRLTAFAGGVVAAISGAAAGPLDGTVRAGTATIAASANTTTITQTSERAVIDWRAFDIAAGETVRFDQPGTQSAVLNRVTGGQFSSLQGTLAANGQVYLVNPNGILIGNGARIDSAAFVASTANISTDGFMASPAAASGRYVFNELTAAAGTASIVNEGTITVADGGLVALVAPAVRNSGTITARLGTIELASSRYFTLDLFGDDLIRIAADDSIAASLTDVQGNPVTSQLNVGGELRADGGRVVLLAVPAAANVVDNAINLSGIVRARTVTTGERGEIQLLANGGPITIGGSLDASAPAPDAVNDAAINPAALGGNITAIGSTVRVTSSGSANASGAAGGGRVVLGGRYTADEDTSTRQTLVDAGASVRACGTIACALDGTGGNGNGGEVRLYSTDLTRVAGEIDVSSSNTQVAGVIEVLSNNGPAELAPTARLLARTGLGQLAGFTVVAGETLDISRLVEIEMRDIRESIQEDEQPLSSERIIAALDPGDCDPRCYVLDNTLSEANSERETFSPLVLHAYANDGVYDENSLPDVNNRDPNTRIFARSRETPVGTLRPNGGVPTTLAASTADPLAAIPITLVPPSLPPGLPLPPPGGSNEGPADISGLASRAVRESVLEQAYDGASRSDVAGDETVLLVGGPGVARAADLGRSVGVYGASLDVFGVNHHVIAPAADNGDARVADYLCKTPYATDGCRSAASSR